ncbi:MAG TPA: hypothetical protein VIH61_00405 [Waddliaceae bacterium]
MSIIKETLLYALLFSALMVIPADGALFTSSVSDEETGSELAWLYRNRPYYYAPYYNYYRYRPHAHHFEYFPYRPYYYHYGW